MMKMKEEKYFELSNLYYGVCRSCKFEQECCEPDAREYECNQCGKPEVYGLEELLMMGELEIT
jgi:hypothetical protein